MEGRGHFAGVGAHNGAVAGLYLYASGRRFATALMWSRIRIRICLTGRIRIWIRNRSERSDSDPLSDMHVKCPDPNPLH